MQRNMQNLAAEISRIKVGVVPEISPTKNLRIGINLF